MPLPKWTPEDPSGKLRSGIDPRLVILSLILVVVLAVVVAVRFIAAALHTTSSSVEEPSPQQAARQEAAVTEERAPARARETAAPPRLPSIRGYVQFGARTFIVSRAEAHLSKDKNKIVVIMQGDEDLATPPLSFVFDLKPNSPHCDIEALRRNTIVVSLPIGPPGMKAFGARLPRFPESPGAFPEIERFECIREVGGALSFSLVGVDEETSRRTGWRLGYGVSVETILAE